MDGTGRRNEALSSEVIEVDKVEVTSRADLPCLNFDGSTEAGLFDEDRPDLGRLTLKQMRYSSQ